MASIYKTKILITFSAVLLIFTGIVVGNKYIFDYSSNKEVAGVNLVNGPDLPPTHDPKFDIILPKGRDITKEKIVYDPKRNFAKYEDNINSVDIIVSEQPVPEMFKPDPIYGIKKVANDFGVKELILNEGTEIYYDKNDKGMQTLIFTKKNLFIFIMTTKEVDKEAFKVYIENLD